LVKASYVYSLGTRSVAAERRRRNNNKKKKPAENLRFSADPAINEKIRRAVEGINCFSMSKLFVYSAKSLNY
jgi:hydroxypyruvate isomerase